MKYISNSVNETKELGKKLAKQKLLSNVIVLQGELGSGKTAFTQGFAKGLGIKDKITSPTFVIVKRFKNFYHIDCYRLKSAKEIISLDFKSIIKNPKNIVIIEWPEIIKKFLPKNIITITFKFIDENKREINVRR